MISSSVVVVSDTGCSSENAHLKFMTLCVKVRRVFNE